MLTIREIRTLTLEQIDAGLVSAFLEHLEDERKNAAVTRNVRLAAIKSFFRFLEYRQPAALEQIRRVLAIPFKKTDTRLVPYLLREELKAVLDAPDPATRDGIRDRAMLHVAVCAGLRVSELTGLKVDDIDLPSMSIRVLGKGRRERTLPLWKPAAAALRAWLAIRGQVATPEVFVNARGEPLSRWGFAYLLRQHAATAARKQPGLAKKTRLAPRAQAHLRDGRSASDPGHPEGVAVAGPRYADDHRGLHARRSNREARCDGGDRAAPPAARRLPAHRPADRTPQAYLVMESGVGGDWCRSAIKLPPAPHYWLCP
ncbi:integrase [Bradyrhizobium japonicum]